MAGWVLLASGDAAFAELYRETLASVGWQVEVVHDWRSTRERLHKLVPDVVVLDTLPDLKPVDALAQIRRTNTGVPVVLLADTLETADLERAKDLGVLGILIKTRATRQTLSETLRTMLEKRSAADRSQG